MQFEIYRRTPEEIVNITVTGSSSQFLSYTKHRRIEIIEREILLRMKGKQEVRENNRTEKHKNTT
jgi:hypothetical protein